MFTEPGSARQEAERLVAVILATATMAANANPHLSTGSPECCVCPLCKVIAAVRDPDPEVVERIATGAGDLAVGLASFLRNVSAGSDRTPGGSRERSPAGHTPKDPWKAATAEEPQAPKPPVKKVAKKAVKKAIKKVPPKSVT